MTAFDKLKAKFEQDPLTTMFVGSLVIAAMAKLIDATSAAQGRRAYARQVDYRVHGRR
jgi:hypothetical protein